MTEQLLTVAEVAGRLRLSPRTARRMVRDGTLPARRITTRIWLVAAADLERWLDERKVPVVTAGEAEQWRKPEAWA